MTEAHAQPTEGTASRSVESTFGIGQVLQLPLEALQESEWNPRRSFDDEALKELAASITVHGVLQPLLVRPAGVGHLGSTFFVILAGSRRFRAAKLAGLATVPCLVRDGSQGEQAEVALVENLQRAGVPPLEEARALQVYVGDGGLPRVIAAAERLGKSPGYVWDRLRLLALIPKAQELLAAGRLPVAIASRLARLTPAQQKTAIDPNSRAVFEGESRLWDLDDDRADAKDQYLDLKPRTVREVDAWIAEHVRFDAPAAATAAPLDFGETAERVTAATAQPGRGRKVIPITHDSYVHPEAKAEERTYCGASWKRADGQEGSQPCDRSVLGVVVVGPEYGQAYQVCIHKECDIHWKQERLAREKHQQALERRGATKETAASTSEAAAETNWRREEARQNAAREAFKTARPAIVAALIAAAKKASVPLLMRYLLSQTSYDSRDGIKALGLPKTADQLIRVLVLAHLLEAATDNWSAPRQLPKQARAIGVDVLAIVKAAGAPVAETSAVKTSKGKGRRR